MWVELCHTGGPNVCNMRDETWHPWNSEVRHAKWSAVDNSTNEQTTKRWSEGRRLYTMQDDFPLYDPVA